MMKRWSHQPEVVQYRRHSANRYTQNVEVCQQVPNISDDVYTGVTEPIKSILRRSAAWAHSTAATVPRPTSTSWHTWYCSNFLIKKERTSLSGKLDQRSQTKSGATDAASGRCRQRKPPSFISSSSTSHRPVDLMKRKIVRVSSR